MPIRRTRRAALAVVVGLCLATLTATPAHAQAVSTQAADVWVLPDFDPYQESFDTWTDGNAQYQWLDGISNVGQPSPFFLNFDIEASTLDQFLNLGSLGVNVDILDTTDATASHQLVSPGSLDFTADVSAIPSSFTDGIALSCTAPEGGFDALGLTGFTITGDDAAFFDLDPAGLPDTVAGDSFALDLLFTGTQQRDYSATLNIQTDTPGLVIPFAITGSVVPEPASAGVLLLAGAGLITRRRR